MSSALAEESLFTPKIADSPLVRGLFSCIEKYHAEIVDEWIRLTEIPAPSGYEKKRTEYMKQQFMAAGFDEVFIDSTGNVIGIWQGSPKGKRVILSVHMDTVFFGVWEIKVKKKETSSRPRGLAIILPA